MMRDRSIHMGQEQNDMATLVRQRDDAAQNAKTLTPLAQAAVNLSLQLDMDTADWWVAYQALGDVARRYIDEYGTEIDS